ncbi:MAG: porin [Proteobacteria bacterium]|nr:porin [Pseudomonadota bacterium]
MQKKIIALAVAGLASTAAFAQTNVTIYGIADAYVAQVRSNGSLTSTQVGSGGLSTSRIGFKGVEDLGNGLKALFVLEYRLDVDRNLGIGGTAAGNASGPARQQLVGLTGGFGTVAAGRLQTTAFDWQVKYITLGATAFDGYNKMTGAYRINLTNDSRAENAVAYISPSMGGVTVALNHAFALEQAASSTASNYSATLLGVYFDKGPFSIGFVGEKLQGGGASESVEVTDLALGTSFDAGFAKFTGTYQTTKNNAPGLSATAQKFNSVYHLGAQIPVSAKGTVHVQWAQNNNKTSTHVGDDNGKGLAVAYTHALSKRTTAYAGYGYLDNSGNGSSYSYGTSRPEGSSNIIAAGVRHSF